jgi:MFS transporter, DHA1 family, multidrug resistance protein
LRNKATGQGNGSAYIMFLAAIATAPALATDMYLAAMPIIAKQWGVPDSRVALSLVLWFASFSLFLLVCGPLSDKHGRRPVLLAGLALFAAASLACALATNVMQLVIFRILQGIGAAGPSSMCMAICRDRYEGPRRKHILAWIGIILGLAPMIAPMLGTVLLRLGGWRTIFVMQGTLGGMLLAASWRVYRETAAERIAGHLLALMGRYVHLACNRRYMLSVMAMGLIAGPFFGFIAFAPIIYIQIYGLSNRAFSVLFGLNALMGMCGAFVCTRAMKMLPDVTLLTVCFAGCAAGGAGILTWGGWHPAAFAAAMCTVTFFCGMSRPLSNNLILEQVRHDIGSASSFIVFYQFMVGALCMKIVTAPWHAPIRVFGLVALLMPTMVLALWPLLLHLLRTRPPAVIPPESASAV